MRWPIIDYWLHHLCIVCRVIFALLFLTLLVSLVLRVCVCVSVSGMLGAYRKFLRQRIFNMRKHECVQRTLDYTSQFIQLYQITMHTTIKLHTMESFNFLIGVLFFSSFIYRWFFTLNFPLDFFLSLLRKNDVYSTCPRNAIMKIDQILFDRNEKRFAFTKMHIIHGTNFTGN